MGPKRSRPRCRRCALTFGLALLALFALTSTASADLLTPQSGGSPNADEIDSLYKIILAFAAVIFFGVEGALVYSLIKFRARKGAVAAQIRGNTRLEVGWTLGAAGVLVILAIITFAKLGGIRNPPNSDPGGFQAEGVQFADAFKPEPPNGKSLNIKVNGQQYIWRYTYPDATPNNTLDNVFAYEEMVVPTGTTVTLDIQAQDVAHSWWIPDLGGKFDAVPGHTNHTWFKIDKPGIYTGQCAELCGRNHADMKAQVRAISPAAFEAWLVAKKKEISDADVAAAATRKQLAARQVAANKTP